MVKTRLSQTSAFTEKEKDPNEVELEALLRKDFSTELDDWSLESNSPLAHEYIRFFIEGMRETYRLKKKQRKIPSTFHVPQVKFHRPLKGAFSTRTQFENGKYATTIFIHPDYFRPFLALNAETEITLTAEVDEQIQFSGSVRDFFLDMGREEMDHAIYDSHDLPAAVEFRSSDKAKLSSVHYDAQDHEYRALGTRIRKFMDTDASQETIDSLMRRLKAAIRLRQGEKMSK